MPMMPETVMYSWKQMAPRIVATIGSTEARMEA